MTAGSLQPFVRSAILTDLDQLFERLWIKDFSSFLNVRRAWEVMLSSPRAIGGKDLIYCHISSRELAALTAALMHVLTSVILFSQFQDCH